MLLLRFICSNGQVRIGIDAPQEVQIQRDDVKKRPELIKAVV
ncbi:carbon storage regulator (plasmid) [Piscirickettsia salmonis]|nr:carbon storage regulator [Piscirickettsia salmonis]